MTILFFTVLSCKKIDKTDPNFKIPKVLGHYGAGKEAKEPPNSYASYDRALELDIEGWEIDIYMSKDNMPVLYRDETLQELTKCEGKIGDLNYLYICECRYKNGDLIMTLREFLKKYASSKKEFIVDPKGFGTDLALADSLSMLQVEFSVNFLVVQNSTRFLLKLRQLNADIKIFLSSMNDEDQSKIKEAIITADTSGYDGVYFWNVYLTEENAREAENLGLSLIAGNVRSRHENKKAWAKFPDYIRTDYPEHLKSIIEK